MPDLRYINYSKEHPWRDPGVLEGLYVDYGLSIHDISEVLSCSNETVGRWLDEHGIETREATWEKTPPELQDGEWLRHHYVDQNRSAEQLADRLECAGSTVRTWLDKHEIKRRSRGEAIAARALHEPARYSTGSHGYTRWRVYRDGARERVLVHRLLAVAEYGFDEVIDNVVHHKNAIRWDNRPSNIEVLSEEEHGRIHAQSQPGGESA